MSLRRSQIFLFSCILFIIGIAVASFLPEGWLMHDLWFFRIIIGLAVVLIILNKQLKAPRRRGAFVVFILFIIFGIWRYSISVVNSQPSPDKIWFYNGQEVEFIGTVNKEPDVRINNTKLTVGVENIVGAMRASPMQGNVLITANIYPEFKYGNRLQVKCQLQKPEPFEEFSYDRYLARYDIYSLCYYPLLRSADGGTMEGKPSFTNVTEGKPLIQYVYAAILKIKDRLKDNINFGLPEPEASLLQAMTLGNRRGLPEDLLNKFSQAGISHIIAISGMHIAIISVIIMYVLLAIGLSRRWSFIISTIMLALYILLIGLPASAMRAGLMAFLVMLAINLGRLNKVTNSLLLAACILLLINPRMLRDDIGFQLSFLAVLSIVYIKSIIDYYINRIKFIEGAIRESRLQRSIFDIITVTLSAQVLTLPIIALNFHQVSVVSPLVNVLILPLLPFIMVSGMLASVVTFLSSSLAWLFFTPAYLMLKYLLWVVEISVKLPLAYIEIDYIWVGWVVLFYVIVGTGIYKFSKREVKN